MTDSEILRKMAETIANISLRVAVVETSLGFDKESKKTLHDKLDALNGRTRKSERHIAFIFGLLSVGGMALLSLILKTTGVF